MTQKTFDYTSILHYYSIHFQIILSYKYKIILCVILILLRQHNAWFSINQYNTYDFYGFALCTIL